jgi:20S proteasome alpha/beta subunit
MTVCIAAACQDEDEEKIVLCCDKKLSGALGSTETGQKNRWISKLWRLLTAGDEPDIEALYKLYRRRFKLAENRTTEKIDESIKWPLRQRKRDLSDEYTYSRFNLSYDDFLLNGKERLPDEEFRDALRAIAAISLNAHLIIAGFIDDSAEIYYTDDVGAVRAAHDFAVVGEGQYIAHSVLARREQSIRSTLHATLYNVYEAKRYSEAVGSVGEKTLLAVLSADGKREISSFQLDAQLEDLYEKYGPQKLPYGFSLEGLLYYGDEKAVALAAKAAQPELPRPVGGKSSEVLG